MALALGVLALLLHRSLVPGILHDDGVYLLLARALAEGHGYVYLGVPGHPPAAKFPPLYPTLLALYWTLTGGDLGAVARLAVATNLLSLVGLGVALSRFARVHVGLPPFWSMGCGLLVGLLAAPWRTALVPLTDAPGLLLGVLLVGAATRMERPPPEAAMRATLRFLLLFLMAFHLRTALLAVGVAGVLGRMARGGKERGGWALRPAMAPGVGVVALALPWLIVSRLWTDRIPLEFRDMLGGYGDWLGRMAAMGQGPLDHVGRRAVQVLGEVGRALVPGVPAPARWVLFALLVPFLALGVMHLWRHSRSAVFALSCLTLQVLLWPFVDERMVLPLLPWLVLAVVAGAHRAITGGWEPGAAPVRSLRSRVAPVVLGVWVAVLAISLGIQGSRPGGVAGTGPMARGRVLEDVVEAIEVHVARGAVVGAPEFWAILHLRTGRPVVPSTRFRPGMGMEAVGTHAEQYRQWAVGRVAALVDEGVLHRGALSALAEACGEGAWEVVDEGPGVRLVLLTWDASCRRTVIPDWQETAGG